MFILGIMTTVTLHGARSTTVARDHYFRCSSLQFYAMVAGLHNECMQYTMVVGVAPKCAMDLESPHQSGVYVSALSLFSDDLSFWSSPVDSSQIT